MIRGFRHKGLRNLFERDDGRKVNPDQVDRLRLILSALDQAGEVQDMDQPTFRLHPLKGDRKRRVGSDSKGELASDLPLRGRRRLRCGFGRLPLRTKTRCR